MSLSPQPLGAEGPTYPEMAKEATSKALSDAGLPYEAIQAAVRLTYYTCVSIDLLEIKIEERFTRVLVKLDIIA